MSNEQVKVVTMFLCNDVLNLPEFLYNYISHCRLPPLILEVCKSLGMHSHD
jgi:hypothetical protein